jgi:hypothetical protein
MSTLMLLMQKEMMRNHITYFLIKLIPSLQNENQGLGRWLVPEQIPTPKAGRKKSSE